MVNLHFQTIIFYYKYTFAIFTASLLEVSYCNILAQNFISLSEGRVSMSKPGKGTFTNYLYKRRWVGT